jgi:transcriptional regulator with XRE-family HTH domain
LTLKELGEVVDLADTTISRYENEHREPSERVLEDLADALNTTPEELRNLADEISNEEKIRKGEEVVHITAPSRYVTSKDDISDWRDRVIRDTRLSDEVQIILMGLPAFMDKVSWIIPISRETFIQETGRKRSMVEEYWPEVLDSEYIERVGDDVEWVLRLTFPD